MNKSSRGILLIAIVIAAITLGQSTVIAKDNGKDSPKTAPKKNENSNSSNNSANGQPKSESISNENSGNSSAGKSASEKSNEINSNSNATNKTPVAKKSSNEKINSTTVSVGRVNSLANKASTIRARTSTDCRGISAAAKAKLESDPCSDFIVVFQPGFGRSSSTELIKGAGASVKREFNAIFNGALVNGPLSKMQALANNPNVLVVEDDLEVTITAVQSAAPWGLDRIDQLNLPLSSTFDDGDLMGVNSYSFVVDTGIDATNLDFGGRVVPGFTAVNDGRGSADCNGHGTHVAGIIGGSRYGVAKQTTLIPVRVLDCNGSGSYSSVIAGLDWIAANHRSGDASVVNMSLGGPASSTLDGAVRNLISKGITVVVAAGNSNADACNYSPARVVDAITVGATEINDSRAGYSNFGSCLDIFAPGSAITSTWLGSSATNTISGTSMASPSVAGVVARFLSNNPTLTPSQVANSVKNSSTKGVVINAGTNSLNQLLFLNIKPDTVTVAPVDSSPTFKKSNPRGRK
jgi:subtilisin family serine protease